MVKVSTVNFLLLIIQWHSWISMCDSHVNFQSHDWIGLVATRGHFTNVSFYPSRFKFDGNFILLPSWLYWNDRCGFLPMTQRRFCRGPYKILQQYVYQGEGFSKYCFHQIWSTMQKSLSETSGPLGAVINIHKTSPNEFMNCSLRFCKILVLLRLSMNVLEYNIYDNCVNVLKHKIHQYSWPFTQSIHKLFVIVQWSMFIII